MIYDIAVVGNGLVGSAAIKYLSLKGSSCLSIGPDEPKDYKSHQGVFSSHYDEGRLTYTSGKTPVSSLLNRLSVEQYPLIEEQSGIKFHYPTGLLRADSASPEASSIGHLCKANSLQAGINGKLYSATDRSWQNELNFISLPENYWCHFEKAPAGHINPRALIRAQLEIARKQGAGISRDTVADIRKKDGVFILQTAEGNVHQASKVIVCTGGFANFYQVLPRKLSLRLKSESVILAEISENEVSRLKNCPCFYFELESSEIESVYITPPLKYPDGRWYIKLGCDTASDKDFTSFAEVSEWFKSEDPSPQTPSMLNALRMILPGIEIKQCLPKNCLISYTDSGINYIDEIEDGLFVAVGGNGHSAKSSDCLGSIATRLAVNEKLPVGLEISTFKACFAD